jgi:diguanylate cyclase (GGDEF)-like protein
MSTPFSELLRTDPLTGCKNYLGFLETLARNSLSDSSTDERPAGLIKKYQINASIFSAILFIDMNDLSFLNETKGFAYGDSALHWLGILLQEECNSEVYRLGNDEFAVLHKIETREGHLALVERILHRMELEAKQFGFPDAAADMALIFLDQTPVGLDTILLEMGKTMMQVKSKRDTHFMVFDGMEFLQIPPQAPATRKSNHDSDLSFSVRWLSINNIYQVLAMGKILDETQQEAYTDAISGLPNLKAALLRMEKAVQNSMASGEPFSIIMIDGDNIRAYNSINYAAGDEMIRDMCAVFKRNIRPNDFIARWRTGDEFMIILPETSIPGANIIAERIRLAIKEASTNWTFPVTISVGIASYPDHGDHLQALIDKVEFANKRAKDQGKDQVVLAD